MSFKKNKQVNNVQLNVNTHLLQTPVNIFLKEILMFIPSKRSLFSDSLASAVFLNGYSQARLTFVLQWV